jgi:transglutaminase-like putative cysteine protease
MTVTRTAPPPPPASTPAPAPASPASHPHAPVAVNDVRRTLLALLASALGVFPLCELFTDRGWLIDVWLSMIVVVAPALVLRRTRPASAWQVWIGVAVLIPWLTVNFVRASAVLGVIPLGGAWHDVGQLMTDLHQTTSEQAAPVHTTVAIRLALCALLGLVAALVDLLAVVGRRGALAGVPLLVVYTVAGAVPRRPVSWVWFALAAAGFLILLALDSSDDLQRWGHYIPRSGRAARKRAAGAVSGQRIAAAAIVAAVLLPIFMPADAHNFVANLFHPASADGNGFGADSVKAGSGTNGIDPFAALRGQLNRDRKVDLLKVTTTSDDLSFGSAKGVQPFYLRTNVLPVFTGRGWQPAPHGALESVEDTQFDSSPGTSFQPRVVHFTATMTVSNLRSNPPVFLSPTAVEGLAGTTEWSPQDQLLVSSSVTGGQKIREDVAQAQPTVADLSAATGSDPALRPWLRLPAIASYVRTLTAQVVGKASTPYAKARAISDFFADPDNGFYYSLQTQNGDSTDDLTNFLKNRAGYCQQYAAAMGVMLRLAGVPARVVLGYAHDVPDSSGTFTVTTYDAHAWVEAYFPGVGWVPFDPTPVAGISGGATNDLAWAPHNRQPVVAPRDRASAGQTRPTIRPSDQAAAPSTSGARTGGGMSGAVIGVLVVLVLVAILLLIPAFVRWRRRRHRIRQARHGDTDALWLELSDTAVDLGYVWSTARTPRQVATWLRGTSSRADASLGTLSTAVERARYAPRASQAGPELVHELHSVESGLRSRRSGRERFQAIFWPASLDWSQVPVVGQWLPGSSEPRRRH